ncbi:hypothetical protein POM88_017992 [Heracleum sosnowskyi]|uniref:Uncharacterized protein n=1 Tax=Heracleum sosnowskyi TaxID=360622 RepID=A0AAD8IPN7_9APIA|nr:hypothetical protein POM88_017992 [Heracleum sosnowskyi]
MAEALQNAVTKTLKLVSFNTKNTVTHSTQISVSKIKINTLISCCLNSDPKPYLSPLVKPGAKLPSLHPEALTLPRNKERGIVESPSLTSTDSLCMELRLSTFWKSPQLEETGEGNIFPKRGVLKIHGLWSGYIDESLKQVVHYYNQKGSLLFPTNAALKAAKENYFKDVKIQLDADEIQDLKAIWFDGDKEVSRFWANECVKHNQYAVGDYIPNYFGKRPGYGSKTDLRSILLAEGFEVGQYHNAQKLQEILKKHLGVNCYLTFYDHHGHPCLSGFSHQFSVSVKRK